MSAKKIIRLEDFTFSRLTADFDLTKFSSKEKMIDEFLVEDAINYQNQNFGNTYLFHDTQINIAAYFCISNDCLNDKGYENNTWNRFHRKQAVPNEKRIKQYPAIKIGRLGVDVAYQGTGLAYELMDFIKGFSITGLKPACRLLLLDAINKPRQLQYYDRNEFRFLLSTDEKDENRIMYFDLKKLQ